MKWIFISAFAAWIFIKFPAIFFLTGFILLTLYLINKSGKTALEEAEEEAVKPFVPYEEFHKTAYKPGFQDDQEWKKKSESLKAYVEGKRLEVEAEEAKEREEYIKKLQRRIRQLERSI